MTTDELAARFFRATPTTEVVLATQLLAEVMPDLRIVEVEGDRITTEDEDGQRTTATARETVVLVAGMLGAMEG